jgi:5-methylcytosine-specific restriction enzyme A
MRGHARNRSACDTGSRGDRGGSAQGSEGGGMKLTTLKPSIPTLRSGLAKLNSGRGGEWRTGKGTTAARGYGGKWQRARLEHLAANPLCVQCEANGLTVVGEVVDHKIPHRGNQDLFWSRTNWQTLCAACHNSKTQREIAEGL